MYPPDPPVRRRRSYRRIALYVCASLIALLVIAAFAAKLWPGSAVLAVVGDPRAAIVIIPVTWFAMSIQPRRRVRPGLRRPSR